MRRTGDKTRFYVYGAEGSEVGPLSFEEIQGYDAEAWVRKTDGEEYWPRRRWMKDGGLSVTQYEHYRAWLWLLAFAPAVAYFFAPGLLRVEWGIAWMIAIVAAAIGVLVCKADSPRFPGE